MTQFEGIWVPMVTPFRNGALDLVAAARLAKYLWAGGIAGLVICGTTGEPATMTWQEQQQLLGAVAEAVPDCPLLFGLSGNDTRAVAACAATLSHAPVAGLLVTAPYYTRPSQAGIQLHFEAVAAATPLPIVLYNIPYRTGVQIDLTTCRALAANDQFVAIKESGGGNLEQLRGLIETTPLKVLGGEDGLIFLSLCMGGHGAIAAAAHIRPDLYVAMHRRMAGGDLAGARAIDRMLQPLINLLFAEPNPAPVKYALATLGLLEDELRLPMLPISLALRERIQPVLEQMMAICI
ncbi:MAG: 4-hydroxy-tetrahydrodipicolinate synthase [Burkholderiales bacterium]|nr:4-hydroxy-tetrahydrodipicolinate synthase [Burkholderiales bacterium]